MSKPKIYIFNNGGSPGWYNIKALSEDGCFIAGHLCSHPGFMANDMGITSNWKHEAYNKHYPDGWELELVEDLNGHTGFQAAYTKHKAYSDAEYEERMAIHDDTAQPSVVITYADN